MVTDERRVWTDPKVAEYFEAIRRTAQERPMRDDSGNFLQFDYERAAEYAAKGMPYIAHAHSRSGEIVNMTTGQVVMK